MYGGAYPPPPSPPPLLPSPPPPPPPQPHQPQQQPSRAEPTTVPIIPQHSVASTMTRVRRSGVSLSMPDVYENAVANAYDELHSFTQQRQSPPLPLSMPSFIPSRLSNPIEVSYQIPPPRPPYSDFGGFLSPAQQRELSYPSVMANDNPMRAHPPHRTPHHFISPSPYALRMPPHSLPKPYQTFNLPPPSALLSSDFDRDPSAIASPQTSWLRIIQAQTNPHAVSITTSSSSSSSIAPNSSRPVLTSQYQTVIDCGYINEHGDRQLTLFSPFFGKEIEVYTAENDPTHASLYRVSALAEKIGCATNKVGMYLARRRHMSSGIYQATQFRSKPPGRTGLKAGGYFLTQEACQEFEYHFRTKLVPNISRRKKRGGNNDDEHSSDDDSDDDNEDDDRSGGEMQESEPAAKSRSAVKRKSVDALSIANEERDSKRPESLFASETVTARPTPPFDDITTNAILVNIRGHSTTFAQGGRAHGEGGTNAVMMSGPYHHDQSFLSHPHPWQPQPQHHFHLDSAHDRISSQYEDRRGTPPRSQPLYQFPSQSNTAHHHPSYQQEPVHMPRPYTTGESPDVLPHFIPPYEPHVAAPLSSPYDTAQPSVLPQWKDTQRR